MNINREHPEYVARKAMYRQYKDLYAGGERFRGNAMDYLTRRLQEPGQVYQERLSRVFYENYIGVDYRLVCGDAAEAGSGDRVRERGCGRQGLL
jgi:hypothetical protein